VIDNFLSDLKLNHIGIVINRDSMITIEQDSGNKFIHDKIQGVYVCFVWDKYLNLYKEYITKEGRVKNAKMGFNHICYDIETHDEINKLHSYLLKNRLGIRLTLPEPSPVKHCNYVSFYKIVGIGIVEFNIKDL
jgi:hypothetical protein